MLTDYDSHGAADRSLSGRAQWPSPGPSIIRSLVETAPAEPVHGTGGGLDRLSGRATSEHQAEDLPGVEVPRDYNAVRRNKVPRRIGRRVFGKVSSRIARKWFGW